MGEMNDRIQKSNRKYNDTLFRVLFHDEERAIELCNAVIGTSYPKGTPVTICSTGEDSLLRRFNDVAYDVDGQLIAMFEHQASPNPNMCLRFLPYITDTLFTRFVNKKDLYGKKRIYIPTPKFYVLYNGPEKIAQDILRLSDSFKPGVMFDNEFTLDLTVKILNVNHGSNCEALKKSKSLNGYAYLISLIRKYIQEGHSRDQAISVAMDNCIKQGVLVDFLNERYKEVCEMLGFQYSLEDELEITRDEAKEEGKAESAIEMLKDGLSVEKVAQYTKMPVEWVEGLSAKV